jgi:hypothetical protein
MDLFKVLYYPNSECSQLTLAKSILVFDEMTFIDHPSVVIENIGTVGHPSMARHYAHILKPEGYKIEVLQLNDGPLSSEIKRIVDGDLSNDNYRRTFFKLIQNDPSFLMSMIPDGNYGDAGTEVEYRKRLLTAKDSDVPRTVAAIESYKPDPRTALPPEMLIALYMSVDSFKLSLATYIAADENTNLFGDSVGMDMLLTSRLTGDSNSSIEHQSVSHKMAYTLLEKLIPNKSFVGKQLTDIVRFRNSTAKERKKFNEHILEYTIELQNFAGKEQTRKFDEVLYSKLLPEARTYQEAFARSWDKFFKESTSAVISDSKNIAQVAVTMLPVSHSAALLSVSAELGLKLLPSTIQYLKTREMLKRNNPYAYLMKF